MVKLSEKKRGMNLKNHYPIEKIKEMNPTERVGSTKKTAGKCFVDALLRSQGTLNRVFPGLIQIVFQNLDLFLAS